jgi:hypothetical protein
VPPAQAQVRANARGEAFAAAVAARVDVDAPGASLNARIDSVTLEPGGRIDTLRRCSASSSHRDAAACVPALLRR